VVLRRGEVTLAGQKGDVTREQLLAGVSV
jgi:hypothetical protein